MTGRKEFSHMFDASAQQAMKLGDSKEVNLEGKGSAVSTFQDGAMKSMHNVYYVPKLAHNLLSIGQLIDCSYTALFGDKQSSLKL